jgi:nifR3 family TIM-barrel protein
MFSSIKGLSNDKMKHCAKQKPSRFDDRNAPFQCLRAPESFCPSELLPKDAHGCPYLFLAPMEGVGDRCFRRAMASVAGFDEAVTDFLRVPTNAHVQSLARVYEAGETHPIPLAAQLMGSDVELMALMAGEVEKRGAPRIDLNCGCPSNTVTGRGAGSSLLKDPDLLHQVARAMVRAVSVPVTIKMRSGYEDTSRFRENLLAAQESGAKYITLHPRTKFDGYGPPARWELIAEAKSFLKIPVVGNGDILTVDDAVRMLKMTCCDALMIGRGSVINPFIFHQIRSYFARRSYQPAWEDLKTYLEVYITEIPVESSERLKINKMKQLMGFLFKGNIALLQRRQQMLTATYADMGSFLSFALPLLEEGWKSNP